MRGFTVLMVLSCLFLTLPAFAQSELGDEGGDDGPMLMGEFAYLDLPGEDDTLLFRGLVAYTFDFGFQIGGGMTAYHLERPSVAACPLVSDEPLSEAFTFWGLGPFAGWNLELVDEWFGLELTVVPTFPVTTGSKGWSIEVGADAYLSFEGASDGDIGLALMAGIKYGHFDILADHYDLQRDEILPTAGLFWQF